MATWRCPNCGTLQVESGRCFLCDRSATSCGTCVNYRHSLVGGLGYCAVGKADPPLSGAEQRPCWSGVATSVADGLFELPVVTVSPPPPERGLLELRPSRPLSGR